MVPRAPPGGPKYRAIRKEIKGAGLNTVCEEANCPNIGECWERGTATFMILGDTCTRRCGFCNINTGKPTFNDPIEGFKVAAQVKKMGLKFAVITSVDRDDLPDYGAGAFVQTIRAIKAQAPDCQIEVLTPDFRGQEMPLAKSDRRPARRLQPQRRGRPAPLPVRAPRIDLRAQLARAARTPS